MPIRSAYVTGGFCLSKFSANSFWRLNIPVLTCAFALILGLPNMAMGQKVTSITFRYKSILGGYSQAGTIALNTPATGTGFVVSLTTASSLVTLPATVTVPKGAKSIYFSFPTQPVGTSTPVSVKATSGSSSASGEFSIVPPAIQSVSFLPSSVTGGQNADVLLFLTGQVPASGASVRFTSNSSSWGGPTSIVIPGGSNSTRFTITTSAVAVNTTARVTATVYGSSSTASLTILAPVLSAFDLSSNTAAVGSPVQGTVTISSPAPKGGLAIKLKSDSTVAVVPSSVSVPVGQTAATFTVKTLSVSKKTIATLTSTLGTSSLQQPITVSPLQLNSLTFNPGSVIGGLSTTGIISLNAPAPKNGATVTLSSSDGSASVPATISIPQGSTTAYFQVTTTPVVQTTQPKISASLGSSSIGIPIQVAPPVFDSLVVPASPIVSGSNTNGTITLLGNAPAGGWKFNLTSDQPSVTVANSVLVPAGSNSVQFAINSKNVVTLTVAQITATDPFGYAQKVSATFILANGLAASAWPKYKGDPRNSGQGIGSGAKGTLSWKSNLSVIVSTGVSIGSDGTLYFGSEDGNLYAVKPDGTPKWQFATGAAIRSTPAVAADGTIYFGSEDTILYALNPDGSKKWSYQTGGAIDSSPTVSLDGSIIFGSADQGVYFLDPTGQKYWSFFTLGPVVSSPAIGIDGSVLICSQDGSLYSFAKTGRLNWSYATGNPITVAPTVASDGTIYISGSDQNLDAITSTGTLKWQVPLGTTVLGGTSVASNGMIFITCADSTMVALDSSGNKQWTFATNGPIKSAPTIGGDGTITIGSSDGFVYGVSQTGKQVWSYNTGNPIQASVALNLDGSLFIGSQGLFSIR